MADLMDKVIDGAVVLIVVSFILILGLQTLGSASSTGVNATLVPLVWVVLPAMIVLGLVIAVIGEFRKHSR